MRLKVKSILNMFIEEPKTDREIGHNTALIKILKEELGANTTEVKKHDVDYSDPFTQELRRIMQPVDFKRISRWDINHIKEYMVGNSKLNAVKVMKEITGLGLKEAKDIIDFIHPDSYRSNL
jgi:ribosomal protein L7/L12